MDKKYLRGAHTIWILEDKVSIWMDYDGTPSISELCFKKLESWFHYIVSFTSYYDLCLVLSLLCIMYIWLHHPQYICGNEARWYIWKIVFTCSWDLSLGLQISRFDSLLDNSPATLQLHSYKCSHIGTSTMASV